jgi:SAM-dependent methyltransferase
LLTFDIYPEIIERTKKGDKILDLGCCFGQEIRQLVLDGAPSANTYGSDLWDGYITLGYELFQDRDSLHTTFIAADAFDDSSPLVQLAGQMDIIYTGQFFHLFNLEHQEKLALRVVQLLAPKPGSLIVGRHSGSKVPGEAARVGVTSGRTSYRHNPQSWSELWSRVGEQTGSRWLVEADLQLPEFARAATEDTSVEAERWMEIVYTIKRL